jgi:hypothetical protein
MSHSRDSSDNPAAKVRVSGDLESIAKTAVDYLGVVETIRREAEREGADSLFARLEECDTFAEAAPVNSDMMFLALSLPIANGLIYFGTSRDRLRRSREWAAEKWPQQDDPISTLAALTLIYIVKMGWHRFRSEPEKSQIWSRINGRVEKLKQDSESPPPDAA